MQDEALVKDLAQCGSPDMLIATILRHRPDWRAPVEVEELARSVGVLDIRDPQDPECISAVITDLEKKRAEILVSSALSIPRRRFAIAHQVGHFLIATHRGDRQCTRRDLAEQRLDTAHRKEEMQANRFAAGLLMPKPWFVPFVGSLGKPSVAHIPTIATAYAVPPEAAASRYADLAPGMCAFLFASKGIVRYVATSRSFPRLALQPGSPAPAGPPPSTTGDKIAWIATEPRNWLVPSRDIRPPRLMMQILGGKRGLQLIMLLIDAAAERRADEEAEKDATERPKFGRPTSRH